MAHNVRQRADSDAAWTTVLLPSELHNWDTYIFQSINGDVGGTWAPSSVIIIGGSGLQITGPMTIDDLRDSHVSNGYSLTVDSGGYIHVASGALIDIQGTGGFTIDAAGTGAINGTLYVGNGGYVTVQSGGFINADSGSVAEWKTGSLVNQNAGSSWSLEGTTTVGGVAAGTIAIGTHGTLSFAEGVYPSMLSHYQWVPCRGDTALQSPDDWVSNGIGWTCSTESQRKLWHRVGVPGHLTLTDVEVHWRGPSHGTWPPENLTTFNVYKADAGTDGSTLLASKADTSAQGTYESAHSLVVATGLSELFATDEFLLIEMVTESGTNAEASSRWLHADMKVSFTQLRGI